MNVNMDAVGSTTGINDSSSVDPVFQTTTAMILGGSESGNGSNNVAKRRAKRRQMRRASRLNGRKQGGQTGRFGGRRQRRLWQLPKSSIDEYRKWIQEKPEEDRTPNEERFLWKCMIQSLGVVGNSSSNGVREFVDRLETKEPMELTEMEEQFIRLFRKRRKERKARKQQQQEDEPTVSWMRVEGINNNSSTKKNKKKKGFEPQASLESLRESMNKMGFSSDKLKQVRFADQTMK